MLSYRHRMCDHLRFRRRYGKPVQGQNTEKNLWPHVCAWRATDLKLTACPWFLNWPEMALLLHGFSHSLTKDINIKFAYVQFPHYSQFSHSLNSQTIALESSHISHTSVRYCKPNRFLPIWLKRTSLIIVSLAEDSLMFQLVSICHYLSISLFCKGVL